MYNTYLHICLLEKKKKKKVLFDSIKVGGIIKSLIAQFASIFNGDIQSFNSSSHNYWFIKIKNKIKVVVLVI